MPFIKRERQRVYNVQDPTYIRKKPNRKIVRLLREMNNKFCLKKKNKKLGFYL